MGGVHQRVDEAGDSALVAESLLEDGCSALPFGIDSLDGLQGHHAAALVDIAEHLHRMGELLLILDVHPVGEAGQVVLGEPCRHAQIKVARPQLSVDLFVDLFLHSFVNHNVLIFKWLNVFSF